MLDFKLLVFTFGVTKNRKKNDFLAVCQLDLTTALFVIHMLSHCKFCKPASIAGFRKKIKIARASFVVW